MGDVIDVVSVLRLLGPGVAHPVSLRRHRSVLATGHVFESGARWTWQPQASGSAIAGLAFADMPMRVTGEDGTETIHAGEGLLLHPRRSVTIDVSAQGAGYCVWLPWDSVQEVEQGVQAIGQRMAATPLTAGLRAFISSLLTQHESPTLYTDYLVERAVVEMVFGALLESVPRNVSAAREGRAVDRARSLMLIRRGDPEFSVAELARELHISTRSLQRIFAADRSSPADELRDMRVDLAGELLSDPNCDSLDISVIALHAGFKTAAALRRAFASRRLPLPSRVRQHRQLAS